MKRTVDGIVFDSKREAAHYVDLKTLQQAGKIRALRCHTKFVFKVNGVQIGTYTPDFTYIDQETDETVVEDVKAWKRTKAGNLRPIVNREYGIKKKLMLACFGLEVQEV